MAKLIYEQELLEFTPVTFDEEESAFIKEPLQHIGYRFRDQISDIPLLAEGEKLEVNDEAMAGFVKDCLSHWSGLSQKLIAAHQRAAELDRLYGRSRVSVTQQKNVRRSIERSTATIEQAARLISRLSNRDFDL